MECAYQFIKLASLKAFGGNRYTQTLIRVTKPAHDAYHAALRTAIAKAFNKNLTGNTGSRLAWGAYFKNTYGAQTKAIRVAYDVARDIDAKYGTAIAHQIIANVNSKQYTILRPPHMPLP